MAKLDKSTPSSIEDHLQSILEQTGHERWTIQDLFNALKGKGYPLLIILLSLPFCQPIQIPGFSTPFGIAIMFIGLQMIAGRRIGWPEWLLKQHISPKILKTVVQKSLGFFRFLKPLLHARLSWICTDSFIIYVHGAFIALMGLYLALPLPIPLSNLLAAWALFLTGLGLLKEDGLFVCLGYLLGFSAIAVLAYLLFWLKTWATS